MITLSKFINITIFFFFFSTYAFPQYYDIGYSPDYFGIYNLDSSKYRIIKTVLDLEPKKELKRVFNNDGKLMEELVFIDGKLVSGIEYFINPDFPFLQVPRSFKIEQIAHVFKDYKNINTTSSLVQYERENYQDLVTVRLYNNQIQDFYILNTTAPKLYFK